jgi:hypothetical protein
MPTNCPCQGTNENCAYCFGSGIRRDRGASRSILPESKSSMREVVSSQFPLRKATSRRRKRGPIGTVGAPPPPSVKKVSEKAKNRAKPKSRPTAICPYCKLVVFVTAREHLSRCDSYRNRQTNRDPNAQHIGAAVSTRSLERCPECGQHVRADRLGKHIRKQHPSMPVRKSLAQQNGKSKNRGLVPPEPESSRLGRYQSAAEERTHDVSRLYSNNFRDNGRFGSYPTEDDFGDEGRP